MRIGRASRSIWSPRRPRVPASMPATGSSRSATSYTASEDSRRCGGRPTPRYGDRMTVLVWREPDIEMSREALLNSVREARERLADPDQLEIVGYGIGAVAAGSLAIHAKRLGIRLAKVTLVEPDWSQPDPISGQLIDAQRVTRLLRDQARRTPPD